MSGITSAVKMVEGYGRGPDTMLAHISPDEAALVDYLQGGRRVNPTTGLAEYGLFGKILKGLARAAGAIGGFIASGGNPLGAAAGAGLATKLTGGSWKQAGIGAALGGLGAGAGNMIGGVGFMGGGVPAVSAASAAGYPAFAAIPGGMGAGIGGTLGAGAMGGIGGIGAGVGGFMAEPREQLAAQNMTPPPLDPGITYNPLQQSGREYVPFEGDYSKYGERGGEHQFYRPRPVSVQGVGLARGGIARASRAARIGRISGPSDGSGMDDRVPAMLTAGEHVIDKEAVDLIGGGSNDRGHKKLESMKRQVRKKSGIPAPYKPAAARAKIKAGIRGMADGGEVNMWGVTPEETFVGRLQAQRGLPIEQQLSAPTTMDDPAMGFVGSTRLGRFSGPAEPMAERVARQGGTLSSKVGLDRIGKILSEHDMEWEWADDGIKAFVEVVGPNGKVSKSAKTFKDNTSLKTLRDWLGY